MSQPQQPASMGATPYDARIMRLKEESVSPQRLYGQGYYETRIAIEEANAEGYRRAQADMAALLATLETKLSWIAANIGDHHADLCGSWRDEHCDCGISQFEDTANEALAAVKGEA